jgi:hypothetical protein
MHLRSTSFDSHSHIISSFDVLKGGVDGSFHPHDFLYYSLGAEMMSMDDNFEVIAALAAAVLSTNFRGDFLVRQQLNWNEHVNRLQRERQFQKMYRMSVASFNKFIDFLQPWLGVNCKQSHEASQGKLPIVAELIMHCTLCYLARGSVHDISVVTGSVSLFYRALRCGIDAINSCPPLTIKFPVQLGDLFQSASEFESLSSHGLINGCVGALDGWLCQI